MKRSTVGPGQYHLAVAGGCVACVPAVMNGCAPTRYSEVVLTRSRLDSCCKEKNASS